VNDHLNVYLLVVVTTMFLAGCFVALLSVRERIQDRKRSRW
jgi:hypothetical protein